MGWAWWYIPLCQHSFSAQTVPSSNPISLHLTILINLAKARTIPSLKLCCLEPSSAKQISLSFQSNLNPIFRTWAEWRQILCQSITKVASCALPSEVTVSVSRSIPTRLYTRWHSCHPRVEPTLLAPSDQSQRSVYHGHRQVCRQYPSSVLVVCVVGTKIAHRNNGGTVIVVQGFIAEKHSGAAGALMQRHFPL